MLVLPYQNRVKWRAMPWVTWALVLTVLWIFALQRHDEERLARAYAIYGESTLVTLETEHYRLWLQQRQDKASMARLFEIDTALGGPALALVVARSIQTNPEFLRQLRSGAIIKLDHPRYAQWREDRLRFEGQLKWSVRERLQLRADTGQPWRLLTHAWVHVSAAALLGNLLVLFLVGPYAEFAFGRTRFLLAYLAVTAAGGSAHVLALGTPLSGASSATLALAALVGLHYGRRMAPTLLSLGGQRRIKLPIPPLAFLPIAMLSTYQQLGSERGEGGSYWSLIGALAAAALLFWRFRARAALLPNSASGTHSADALTERRHDLARQAREALMRMDTRRAVKLYQQLADDNPTHTGYLTSYFNAALMARDPELLSDASLRVLWLRTKSSSDELRKVFLQMGQPYVLRTLPVDEQLRLARRLVRAREDGAALKVLDSILDSPQLRQLYGRQIADCLLGLFTTYTRYGLRSQAASVRARLKLYFPQPATLGGLAPNTRGPGTRAPGTRGPGTYSSTRPGTTSRPATLHGPSTLTAGPSTLFIDLS